MTSITTYAGLVRAALASYANPISPFPLTKKVISMDHNAQPLVEKMTSEYRDVGNSSGPIELSNILKFEGLVGSGGEAKTVAAAVRSFSMGKSKRKSTRKSWSVKPSVSPDKKFESTPQHRVAMSIMTSQEHRHD